MSIKVSIVNRDRHSLWRSPRLWRDFCYGGQYESGSESVCIVADDGLWDMKVFPLECVYCVSGGLQSLWTTTGTQSDLSSLLQLISHECLIFSLHLHKTPFDLSQLGGQKRQDVREGGILQYCSLNEVYLSLNKHWNTVNIYPHYSMQHFIISYSNTAVTKASVETARVNSYTAKVNW